MSIDNHLHNQATTGEWPPKDNVNPDTALDKTNAKFIRRFNYIEEHSIRIGKPLKDMTLGEMDALWNEAKAQEKK